MADSLSLVSCSTSFFESLFQPARMPPMGLGWGGSNPIPKLKPTQFFFFEKMTKKKAKREKKKRTPRRRGEGGGERGANPNPRQGTSLVGGEGRGRGRCGWRRKRGYVVLFGRFGLFPDHFKSKNLLLNVFVLFFSVFRFLTSSFLLFKI